jgi:hypothetical protein
MSRPTLSELIIALRSETKFLDAAASAPMGSEVEQLALRHARFASAEAKRIETELAQYISALEIRVSTTQFDKRRS